MSKSEPSEGGHKLNALHLIHKWSIEHAYAVVAFYVAMLALADRGEIASGRRAGLVRVHPHRSSPRNW